MQMKQRMVDSSECVCARSSPVFTSLVPLLTGLPRSRFQCQYKRCPGVELCLAGAVVISICCRWGIAHGIGHAVGAMQSCWGWFA